MAWPQFADRCSAMPDEPSAHPELTRLLASDNPGDIEALVPSVARARRSSEESNESQFH